MACVCVVRILAEAITFILIALQASSVFEYLYSKPHYDMRMALPLNTRQRFISETLSLILSWAAPAAVCILTAAVCDSIFSSLREAEKLLSSLPVWYIPDGRSLIVSCASFLQLDAILIFAFSYNGRKDDALAHALVLSPVIAPAIIITVAGSYYYSLYGISFVIEHIQSYGPVLIGSTPFMRLFRVVLIIMDADGDVQAALVTALLMSALYLTAAWLSYRSRKAEKTGKGFSVDNAFIIPVIFVVSSVTAFCMQLKIIAFIAAIVGSMLFFIVIPMIIRKSLKLKRSSYIKAAVSVILSAGFAAVIAEGSFFGAARYVPECKNVNSVRVLSQWMGADNDGCVYTAEENIKLITDIHRGSIYIGNERENEIFIRGETGDYDISNLLKYNLDRMMLEYDTDMGRVRRFCGGTLESRIEMYEVMKSAEYRRFIVENAFGSKNESPLAIMRCTPCQIYPTDEFNEFNSRVEEAGKDEAFMAELYNALIADVTAQSGEDFINPSEVPAYILTNGGARIYIYPCYTRTIAFIKKYRLKMKEQSYAQRVKEYLENETDNGMICVIVTQEEYFEDFPLCREKGYMLDCFVPYTRRGISEKYVVKNYVPDEDYFMLMDVSIPSYITKEAGYTIYAGSTRYVPPEYSGLAEKVMKKQRGLRQ